MGHGSPCNETEKYDQKVLLMVYMEEFLFFQNKKEIYDMVI
jgi:hypothetical protein